MKYIVQMPDDYIASGQSDWIKQLGKLNKKESKMTRQDYINRLNDVVIDYSSKTAIEQSNALLVDKLIRLGVIKVDEEEQDNYVHCLIVLDDNGEFLTVKHSKNYHEKLKAKYDSLHIEEWPQGLVLLVGGEIKWKSWEEQFKVGDSVWVKYGNVNPPTVGKIVRKA